MVKSRGLQKGSYASQRVTLAVVADAGSVVEVRGGNVGVCTAVACKQPVEQNVKTDFFLTKTYGEKELSKMDELSSLSR